MAIVVAVLKRDYLYPKIFSKRRVLEEDRLNSTARVNKKREKFVSIKLTGIAIRAKITGASVRTVEPWISLGVISGFFI